MRLYRHTTFLILLLTSFSVRCAQETEAQPTRTPHDASAYVLADPSEDTFALGSRLTPNGAVADNSVQELYNRGEKLFVSVDLIGSSQPKRDVEVLWQSATGAELSRGRATVDVKKRYATFESGMTSSWAAGPYEAIIVIDGRQVAERPFKLK